MLKQGQFLKQLQKLSPQQIQFMKLLQIPTATIEERIKEELEANPALEEGEDENEEDLKETQDEDLTPVSLDEVPTVPEVETPADSAESVSESSGEEDTFDTTEDDRASADDTDLSDYMDEDEVADYKLATERDPDDDDTRSSPVPLVRSFHEYLEEQTLMLDLDERQLQLARYIVGSIDDDGYMRRPLDAMVDDIMLSLNTTTDERELEALLLQVQQLDPPGIAARNLQECLLIQLKRAAASEGTQAATKPKTKSTPTKSQPSSDEHHGFENDNETDEETPPLTTSEAVVKAQKIIEQHFDEFVKKHYEKIQRRLELDEAAFKQVMEMILHLNPKPGSAYAGGGGTDIFLLPDFYVTNSDGELELQLNGINVPDLRISNSFKEMMRDYSLGAKKDKKQKEAVMFIKQKIDSAKWFIDAIRQRQQTLMLTMRAILDYQKEYFLTGDDTKLRPMILKDIADRIHMDISTVSRVANSKYVQTEFGTFKLKSFFSESLSTESGEEVSTREVKKILTDLISAESKKKPLSDEKLTQLLNEKGYNIARRTVAKYREQLDIPVARLRRQL
jgi:RNA polymerase sigma-54 factor